MFSLIITEKDGPQRRRDFDKTEISIGRIQGNDVVLPKGNVSKRHARLRFADGKFIIRDLNSTNGTYVNGRRITSPQAIKPSDKVYIGDFILSVEIPSQEDLFAVDSPPPPMPEPGRAAPPEPGRMPPGQSLGAPPTIGQGPAGGATLRQPPLRGPAGPPPSPVQPPVVKDEPAFTEPPKPPLPSTGRSSTEPPTPEAPAMTEPAEPPQPPPVEPPKPKEPEVEPLEEPKPAAEITTLPILPSPPPRPEGDRGPGFEEADEDLELKAHQAAIKKVMDELRPYLERLSRQHLTWEKYRQQCEKKVESIVARTAPGDMGGLGKERLIAAAVDEAVGFGPLEDLLDDESVREILVNDPLHIYVNHGVDLEREERVFSDEVALNTVIVRLIEGTGARLDEANPTVDVRRKDGMRVTAVIPPVAVRWPVLTLRRSQIEPLAMDDLIANESISPEMTEFLEACVRGRKNILVVGGASSGKTTLLNGLAAAIPDEERIVTVEDGCELVLPQEDVVSLEARLPSAGSEGISTGELVNVAMRLRPDRLVVGDLSSDNALAILRAMNSGYEGILSSLHSVDADGAIERLEAMCLMSGREMPVRTVRELIAKGLDLIVVLTRFPSGERKVTSVLEVTGLDVDLVHLEEIYHFESAGTGPDGMIQGRFLATGYVPRFFEDLRQRGLASTRNLFR